MRAGGQQDDNYLTHRGIIRIREALGTCMSHENFATYYVLRCPCCSGTLRAGGWYLPRRIQDDFWTDVSRVASMLVMAAGIWRCPLCSEPIWLGNIDQLGEVNIYPEGYKRTFWELRKEGPPTPAAWATAPMLEPLSTEKYFNPESIKVSNVQMLWLRLRLADLWAMMVRHKNRTVSPRDRYAECAAALIERLATPNPMLTLVKADLLRQSGRQGEVCNTLSEFQGPLSGIANQIKAAALSNNQFIPQVSV